MTKAERAACAALSAFCMRVNWREPKGTRACRVTHPSAASGGNSENLLVRRSKRRANSC